MSRSSYARVIKKNRREIQSAFAELLAERGSINNITVTDIAERAELTRGNFYNYYNNLSEVGIELQHEIEAQLFSKYDTLPNIQSIEQYIDEIFVFLHQQEPIYRELLASAGTRGFLNQLENEIGQRVLKAIREDGVVGKNIELELLFLTNGTIAMLRKYYQGEINLTLDEIRDYLKTKIRWLFDHYEKI